MLSLFMLLTRSAATFPEFYHQRKVEIKELGLEFLFFLCDFNRLISRTPLPPSLWAAGFMFLSY